MHPTLTFSSPIVNLPCVCGLFSAKDCSFFTGSVCRTVVRNLTFCFVYSWPGFACQQFNCWVSNLGYPHRLWYRLVMLRVSYSELYSSRPECLRKSVHILGYWSAPSNSENRRIYTSNEQSIPSKYHPLITILHKPTNAILCMAGRM